MFVSIAVSVSVWLGETEDKRLFNLNLLNKYSPQNYHPIPNTPRAQ